MRIQRYILNAEVLRADSLIEHYIPTMHVAALLLIPRQTKQSNAPPIVVTKQTSNGSSFASDTARNSLTRGIRVTDGQGNTKSTWRREYMYGIFRTRY